MKCFCVLKKWLQSLMVLGSTTWAKKTKGLSHITVHISMRTHFCCIGLCAKPIFFFFFFFFCFCFLFLFVFVFFFLFCFFCCCLCQLSGEKMEKLVAKQKKKKKGKKHNKKSCILHCSLKKKEKVKETDKTKTNKTILHSILAKCI